MTQIYLIRHGAYTFREQSPYDYGLSPEGVTQAERLRDRLARENLAIDVLVSSPQPRALQTAEIIAPALNNLPIQIEPDFEEWRNLGEAALTQEEMVKQYLALPSDQRAFILPGPGLETWAQIGIRICTALNRLAQEYTYKNIVIVAHGGTIEASFAYCYGISPFAAAPFMMMLDPQKTSITHWRKIHAVNLWRLECYNDASHLRS